MMKEEEKVTDSPSMRVHYAGVCAFWIAGMWVVSWVCMLNFYRYPLLSLLSLVLYAWSVLPDGGQIQAEHSSSQVHGLLLAILEDMHLCRNG